MAACTQITYQFEELPLLTDGKREGLLVWGEADIAAFDDDHWQVRAVWLDGITIELAKLPWLFESVCNALYVYCSDDILEQVRIEDEGIATRMRGYTRSAA